jgi:cell division inhibitor SulA
LFPDHLYIERIIILFLYDLIDKLYCTNIQVIIMNNIIELLQKNSLVWHAKTTSTTIDVKSTGFSELDEQIGGGFNRTGVIDILSDVAIGELRLLIPSLIGSTDKLLVFIAPPGDINAQTMLYSGIDVTKIIVITPKNQAEALWAAELCLKSGSCHAVLLWPTEALAIHHVKRLQVASEKGECQQFILREKLQESLSLPVDIRLSIEASNTGLLAKIDKRKRGWPVKAFNINMLDKWPILTVNNTASNVIDFPSISVG